MAIVRDLSGNNPLDLSFNQPNRQNAGVPNGALTPLYTGEIILDTTDHTLWKAMTLSNQSWIMLTPM
jgi:hypothetical protein